MLNHESQVDLTQPLASVTSNDPAELKHVQALLKILTLVMKK